MPSRRWGKWPREFSSELNSASGAMGIAGLALSAVAVVATPAIAPFVLAAGGITVVGSLGWAAVRSIPKRLERPENLIGRRLLISDLESVEPRPVRMGVVGPTMAGKTTLLDHVRQHPADGNRTEEVYAVIVALPLAPPSYVALLDGAGAEYVQQFKVGETADLLVVVLDHNQANDNEAVDQIRLNLHDGFLDQLRSYLKQRPAGAIRQMHFLLNKQDLWSKGIGEAALKRWFSHQVDEWRRSGVANKVTSGCHSNRDASSVTAFIQLLKRVQPLISEDE